MEAEAGVSRYCVPCQTEQPHRKVRKPFLMGSQYGVECTVCNTFTLESIAF